MTQTKKQTRLAAAKEKGEWRFLTEHDTELAEAWLGVPVVFFHAGRHAPLVMPRSVGYEIPPMSPPFRQWSAPWSAPESGYDALWLFGDGRVIVFKESYEGCSCGSQFEDAEWWLWTPKARAT